jgi:hypothetical protein
MGDALPIQVIYERVEAVPATRRYAPLDEAQVQWDANCVTITPQIVELPAKTVRHQLVLEFTEAKGVKGEVEREGQVLRAKLWRQAYIDTHGILRWPERWEEI